MKNTKRIKPRPDFTPEPPRKGESLEDMKARIKRNLLTQYGLIHMKQLS